MTNIGLYIFYGVIVAIVCGIILLSLCVYWFFTERRVAKLKKQMADLHLQNMNKSKQMTHSPVSPIPCPSSVVSITSASNETMHEPVPNLFNINTQNIQNTTNIPRKLSPNMIYPSPAQESTNDSDEQNVNHTDNIQAHNVLLFNQVQTSNGETNGEDSIATNASKVCANPNGEYESESEDASLMFDSNIVPINITKGNTTMGHLHVISNTANTSEHENENENESKRMDDILNDLLDEKENDESENKNVACASTNKYVHWD